MSDASQIRATSPRSQPCEHQSVGNRMTTSSAISDASKTLPYRHEPLNRGRKSVRLLRVLPGGTDDPIRCTIKHFDLTTQPIYVALSYMWDHTHENVPIYCNGLIVEVGQNLRSFLQQFRKTAGSDGAWLWIDALCINQNDISERNHQVRQMKDIYQGAALVIAWLGAATDDDRSAFRALRSDGITPGKWPWEAWYQLFRKPYWRRTWIIQEFVTGEETHLWCDDLRADSDDFMRAGQGLDGVHNVRETLAWKLLVLRRLWRSNNRIERKKEIGLRKLSTTFAMSNSTDPRDYVYGFLGIAYGGHHLVPDYSKSAAAVLIDVVRIQCKWAHSFSEQQSGSIIRAMILESQVENIPPARRREITVKTEISTERDDEHGSTDRTPNRDPEALRIEEQRQALRDQLRGERFVDYVSDQRRLGPWEVLSLSLQNLDLAAKLDDYIDMQDEIVQDHDFLSHLMRKLGVSRSEMATLILRTAPDLYRHMHIILAKDWRELRLCRSGGHSAITAMFVGIFGLEACIKMELASDRLEGTAEPEGSQRRFNFSTCFDRYKLELGL